MQFELFDENFFVSVGRAGGLSHAHQILAYRKHPWFYRKNQPAIPNASRAERAVVDSRLDKPFDPFCRRAVEVRCWMGKVGNDNRFKSTRVGQILGSRIGQHDSHYNLSDAVGDRGIDIVRHKER